MFCYIVSIIVFIYGICSTAQSYDGHHIRIGTFITATTDESVMNAIRTSSDVFNREYGEAHHCVIKNTFYVGNKGKFPDRDDVLHGSFAENMNSGKSMRWLVQAVNEYPNADYIIKRDTDTAVNYTLLCENIIKRYDPQLVDVYFGRVNDYRWCGLHKHCPPLGCTDFRGKAPEQIPTLATKEHPQEGPGMIKNKDAGKPCYVYMSGGFYGVSRKLAVKMANYPQISSLHHGLEDIQIGKLVAAVGHTGSDINPSPPPPPHVDDGCKCKEDKKTQTPTAAPTVAPVGQEGDNGVKVLNFKSGDIWCHYEERNKLRMEVLSGAEPYLLDQCIKR